MQRQGDTFPEFCTDWFAAGQGMPQVTVQHSPNPDTVLLPEGPIEPEFLAGSRQILLAQGRSLVKLHDDNVAWQTPHQRKDRQRHQEEDEHALQRAAHDIDPHRVSGPYCANLSNFRFGALSVSQAVLPS